MKLDFFTPNSAEALKSQGVPSPKRVIVLGNAGAGKSTLSAELGAKLDIRPTHLDVLYWKPDGVHLSEDEFASLHTKAMSSSQWILDGNYLDTLPERIAEADTVVFLDLPLNICFPRIVKRRLQYRPASPLRPLDGSADRLTPTLLKYVWNFGSTRRPKILKALEKVRAENPGKRVHWLRSPAEIIAFRQSFGLNSV